MPTVQFGPKWNNRDPAFDCEWDCERLSCFTINLTQRCDRFGLSYEDAGNLYSAIHKYLVGYHKTCSQQQEASLSGKNSVNVRQIGSARRRARLSQNAQSLLSEKKKETPNRTHSIDSVKLPPLSLETISRVLKKQGQLHGTETDVGGWLYNAGKIIDSGRFF